MRNMSEYTDDSCSNRKDIFAGHPYSSPSSSEHDDEDKEIELDFSVFCGIDLNDNPSRETRPSESPSLTDDPFSGQVPDWCKCGNCVGGCTELEAVCCNDNPDVMSRLENSGACITDNIFFNHITSEEGIEYSRALEGANIVNSWLREGYLSTAFTNNLKRNLSYRNFVTWINMNIPMGRGNRMVIPRCVVLKIRRSYPEVDHNYAGFQPSESH